MKILSLAVLLCVGYSMADTLYKPCSFSGLKRCPEGWKAEQHGKSAMYSECLCVHHETAAEERKRKGYKDACQENWKKCADTGANSLNSNVCENFVRICHADQVHNYCKQLKDKKRKWQCEKNKVYIKEYGKKAEVRKIRCQDDPFATPESCPEAERSPPRNLDDDFW